MIEIKVNGNVVSVQATEALYCGARDVYTCVFTFDDSWRKYSKSAVFRADGRAVTAVIKEDGTCLLPWELLARDNIGINIDVGVYGISADSEILTSVWDSIGAVREGSELGSDAREPSAGVYEQVMASVQRVDDKIVSYSTEVQTLVQRAESAAAITEIGVEEAKDSAATAANAKTAAVSALQSVQAAINNIPAGSTLVINDLTTGGKSAALSAEMGRVLAKRPNPNLLHNWYFKNAVNQRGKTSYTDVGYTLDRWAAKRATAITSLDFSMAASGAGLVFTNNSTGGSVYCVQTFEEALLPGEYTLSILVTKLTGTAYIGFYKNSGSAVKYKAISGEGVTSLTYTITDADEARAVRITAQTGASVTVDAIKLERGDTQTLAHWNGSSWVLNEIPDYVEELAKCQRYYQLFTSEDKRPADKRDFRPELRTNATSSNTGTIDIDGVTYYYADASL